MEKFSISRGGQVGAGAGRVEQNILGQSSVLPGEAGQIQQRPVQGTVLQQS